MITYQDLEGHFQQIHLNSKSYYIEFRYDNYLQHYVIAVFENGGLFDEIHTCHINTFGIEFEVK